MTVKLEEKNLLLTGLVNDFTGEKDQDLLLTGLVNDFTWEEYDDLPWI